MTAATVARGSSGKSPGWARKYPPLLALLAALLIALAVLPSSLNLPQSNPTETLEFAPVPPEDLDNPPPPSGNLASLGLAGSASLEQGVRSGGDDQLGLPEPGVPPKGSAKTSLAKQCAPHEDGKLRQTEDELSPPCVADFRGDNFGATYQGVSREEVRVLIYFQGFSNYINLCRDPNQATPDKQYFDLAQPGEENEHCAIRALRTWQHYFNTRFQTYRRFVHFFVYVSGEGRNAEERRADAAENYAKVKPFAVVQANVAAGGSSFTEAYLEVMARRGVLNFGSFLARSEDFFNRFPALVWGYLPSLEKQAENFSSYLCTKVAPHPVQFSRNGDNGQDRVYGLWSTKDESTPELLLLAKQVESLVQACRIEFTVKRQFPSAGYIADNRYSPRYATVACADFREQDVSTIIWPAGLETNLSKQCAQLNYFPEVIALGDGTFERDFSATFQDQNFWESAHMVTNVLMQEDARTQQCFQAFRESDPEADDAEARAVACPMYPDLRQLFIGIQVAGPRLTPASIDQGFHAIPPVRSTDPTVPACFYDPGDYTCVKDALVERWVRTADDDDEGCYRATEAGLRYFAGTWPEGNVLDQEKPDDPCNTYDGSVVFTTDPPDDPSDI